MKRIFKRLYIIPLLFVGLFGTALFSDVGWATKTQPPASGMPGEGLEAQTAHIKISDIQISAEYGRVVETFDAGGGKVVVHIQDAHTNYEAQKNSAAILEDLINNHGLYLILVEGGSRDVSLHKYRERATLATRKQIAEDALKEGIIAGEEYLNVASDYPMKLQGIEDRALYDQNMESFLEVEAGREEALSFTRLLSGMTAALKFKVYNKTLRTLDAKRRGFAKQDVDLTEYAKYLKELAALKKIDASRYPNYTRFMTSVEMEKSIDFKAVEKERDVVIEVLRKNVDESTWNAFFVKSLDFKSGKLTQQVYHAYLRDLMDKARLAVNKYPNLGQYIEYLDIYSNISSADLFMELDAIGREIEAAFITTEDQRRLAKVGRDLELLIDFINLKLTPSHFNSYLEREADFDTSRWVIFLNGLAVKYKLGRTLPGNTESVERITPALKSFYTIARQRDNVFLENTQKHMEGEGVEIAALIAGGFHTPTLMQLLRENGISYMVVSPKLLHPTDEELYRKILTEGWSPTGAVGLEGLE